MSKTKKKPVDRAVATIKKSTTTDVLKVSVTHSLAQAMSQSPDWAAATDVQTAVKGWSKVADSLDANATAIAGLHEQVKAAEAKQLGLRRDWQAAKQQVMSTVTVFCGGSADQVKGFNLDVITRQRVGPLAAPTGLTVNPGTTTGEVVSTWVKGLATHGFVAQHATDPSSPATISGSIPCTKPKLVLEGLPSNANVSVRVAAIDPTSPAGQGPWSAWVVGNAR